MSFNRNTSKTAAFAFALVVLTAGVGIALAAGGAVAQYDTTELTNGTADVTNDTESVYVDVVTVDDYNGSSSPNVTVVVEGLQEGQDVGNGTEIYSETRTVANATTESYDYVLSDTEKDSYDSAHIKVYSNGDGSLISSTDWGTLVAQAGGGGGLLSGSIGGLSIPVVLVVLVGGYFVMGRD